MKILSPSFSRMEKTMERAIVFFSWGFALMSAFFWGERLYCLGKKGKDLEFVVEKRKEERRSSLAKKTIGGPLELKENKRSPFALALEQWFEFRGVSSRPDKEKAPSIFCIGIRESVEEKTVTEGELVYVEVKADQKRERIDKVQFSSLENVEKERTHLKFVCSCVDKNTLFLTQKEGEEEPIELFLSLSKKRKKEVFSPEFNFLKEGQLWNRDLLFVEYGGQEYLPLSHKYRLDLKGPNGRSILYVKKGDFLLYREGRWEVWDVLPPESSHFSLAKVVNAEGNLIEIEGWNVEGISVLQTQIFPAKGKGTKTPAEKLFAGVRLRSQNQVSCRLGKNHLLLKKGDWIAKTKGGWHKAKTLGDIESILGHKGVTELLVIDDIDPKGFLKGHHFDEMRTQKISFAVPFLSEKKKEKRKKEGTA